MNYKLILLAGFVVILAIGFGAAYLMLRPATTPTTTTAPSQSFYLLVLFGEYSTPINPIELPT